ncbi:MAG: YbaB/EbfC family nucleoid-associated protein [Segniliparus sp.]|uniref:YbaB/EbfC family nucleoid-associated protein n=1 Tax=Segniliparus sp. TaxID=2804064 RepID=UPI003F3ADD2A
MTRPDAPFEDRLTTWATKAERIQGQLKQIRGKGTAVNGYLVVEADVAGKLLNITTDAPVTDLHHENLQSAILRAYQAACADAQKQASVVTAELYADPEIRDVLRKMNPDAELPGAKPSAPSQPDPHEDGYDEPPQTWLQRL